ncbi:hypothetical protein AAFV24_08795 [Staphylococcus nepalensis]|uniref:hypothetical protein n=1 Tax=Staphylococcus nepalensis TaxID=214473 RepID=UPI001A98A78C|nr:hypothetical protein [Staphylococcus nepalensis]
MHGKSNTVFADRSFTYKCKDPWLIFQFVGQTGFNDIASKLSRCYKFIQYYVNLDNFLIDVTHTQLDFILHLYLPFSLNHFPK